MDYDDLVKRKKIKPLSDLSGVDSFARIREAGYVPFSLGPVYVYAGPSESLVDAFSEAEGDDVAGRPRSVLVTSMAFEHALLSACPGWENVIDIMDFDSYQWFKKWMMSLNFVNRKKQTYYIVRHYFAPLLDPVVFGKHGLRVPDSLDIFCLSGMRANMKPANVGLTAKEKAMTFITLKLDPPEEDVQVSGRAALNILKET